ncbi:MAG TPA: hypothetical protein DIT98_05135 [Verrucomicrobiales bacterium]|nr:hypothetical protein [Verrucomicrobiales bacterium]
MKINSKFTTQCPWGIFAVSLLSCMMFNLLNAQSIHVEKVFGPETDTGQYKHPSSFEYLDNGDFFLVYYGGKGEYAWDTAVFGSRKVKGSDSWSAPVAIAQNPFQSMGNPVLWQATDGRVWLFFVVRFGETWSTSRIMAKISDDRCKTWSDAFVVSMEEGTMVRSRPIVVGNGNYLLPIYHETGADTEKTGVDTSSLFLLFDPAKKKWTSSNKVYSRMGNLQPAAVLIEDQHLMAFSRRGGDYEPGDDGYVVRSDSYDGGKSWTQGVETTFPNPNAAVELIRLANGHLLFVYNNSMDDRSPLTCAVSTDGGTSFPYKLDLMSGEGSFAYPTALQTPDGLIHVLFTSDERTTIRHATFSEDVILK